MKTSRTNINFDCQGFLEYLQSLAGGHKTAIAAKAIVADIAHYYQSFSIMEPYYETLLHMENLKKYLHNLQDRGYCATTVAEKIRRIRNGIEFIMFKENADETKADFYIRCQKVNDNLKKWGKALSKEIKKQRCKHAVESSKEVNII